MWVPCTFDFRNLGLENRNALVPIADNYTLELSKHWTFICLLYAHLSILHTAKVINVTMPPPVHSASVFEFLVRFWKKLCKFRYSILQKRLNTIHDLNFNLASNLLQNGIKFKKIIVCSFSGICHFWLKWLQLLSLKLLNTLELLFVCHAHLTILHKAKVINVICRQCSVHVSPVF